MPPITAGSRPGAPAPGPTSRLKPLLAVLAVVVIAAGAFLFLRGGDDDETPAEVAGTSIVRTTLDPAAAPSTTGGVASTVATTTTLAPSPVSSLTPTQQRELCHVAVVGQVEGKADTGDPLDTCTTDDFVAVSIEVGVYLRADPGIDHRAKLTEQCTTARSLGRNPLACQGIATS